MREQHDRSSPVASILVRDRGEGQEAGSLRAGAGPYDAQHEQDEGDGADEKIGVARITLEQPLGGVSALVSGFFEADRVLQAWKEAGRGAVGCRFAVLFTDGESIRGALALRCDVRARPSLWAHLRQALRLSDKERRQDPGAALVDQRGRVMSEAMLALYDLEKHPYAVVPDRQRAR